MNEIPFIDIEFGQNEFECKLPSAQDDPHLATADAMFDESANRLPNITVQGLLDGGVYVWRKGRMEFRLFWPERLWRETTEVRREVYADGRIPVCVSIQDRLGGSSVIAHTELALECIEDPRHRRDIIDFLEKEAVQQYTRLLLAPQL